MVVPLYTQRELYKPFIVIASIIGIIQALAWTILTTVPIGIYNRHFETDTDNLGVYTQFIYHTFLENGNTPLPNCKVTMTAETFAVFMYVYLVASVAWFLISSVLFFVAKNKNWNYINISIIFWVLLTFAISALDIITMGFFVSDYTSLEDCFEGSISTTSPTNEVTTSTSSSTTEFTSSTTSNLVTTTLPGTTFQETIVLTVYGFMITGAARGYLLWIVNVAFAISLTVLAWRLHEKRQIPRHSFINAYGASPRAFHLYDQTNIDNKGRVNESFQDDEDNMYQNFPTTDLANYKFDTSSDKVAKIGKSGGSRSPPRQVESPVVPHLYETRNHENRLSSPKVDKPPFQKNQPYRNPNSPYIPDPDYSPQHSPKSRHRSVLKSKSNYQY